jgi:hypothetical protein
MKFIENSEGAKQSGLSYPEAMRLIGEFYMFHPYHILPSNKAKKYLDDNWEGRPLDLKHFGLKKIENKEPIQPTGLSNEGTAKEEPKTSTIQGG